MEVRKRGRRQGKGRQIKLAEREGRIYAVSEYHTRGCAVGTLMCRQAGKVIGERERDKYRKRDREVGGRVGGGIKITYNIYVVAQVEVGFHFFRSFS